METYYFGRLNFISKRNLYDLLKAGYKYRSDANTRFGLFEVRSFNDSDLGIVYTGELIKYVDYKQEDVIKEDQITVEVISDAIKGRCKFFLTESDHVIAYNPYGRIISDKAFKRAFSGILIAADDSFDVDSLIYPINYEYQFRSFLQKMKRIDKLTFNLTPSNPNNRETWQNIDDKLNKMNVKKYKEEFLAKDGSSLELDDESDAKITMAEDGYGKATGQGIDSDDNDVVVSTEKAENILKKKVKPDQNDNVVKESLKSTFENIRERFKK